MLIAKSNGLPSLDKNIVWVSSMYINGIMVFIS